jgi:hypothetical protein
MGGKVLSLYGLCFALLVYGNKDPYRCKYLAKVLGYFQLHDG